ncbi:hypothetical protein [Legionella sp. km772]|uniref:hypothetical protein n=1 Tax=Legionella sp. km772 TaxID=2498111 RepID=UPI000F8CB2BC|nr:hypothetical protein [Legionella sp. km772]RUR07706.1 hypothetical protein ELY15_11900 [Legionella sp. km772]
MDDKTKWFISPSSKCNSLYYRCTAEGKDELSKNLIVNTALVPGLVVHSYSIRRAKVTFLLISSPIEPLPRKRISTTHRSKSEE